ncbi:hypothetical protein [Streptomyces sp. SID2888]|uniref:hypothetical protein n=1 Tax=Streptomyces sp. SID2888 TaxID=2690256 RepID=UPI0013708D1C|nr:hypothetical protein [Streptomyces sp. SID2888]
MVDGALHLTVTAHTLLRDPAVFPDRLATSLGLAPHDLVVDQSLLTLLPGEARTGSPPETGHLSPSLIPARPARPGLPLRRRPHRLTERT